MSDVLIVGGGASGMMTAIRAARSNHSVTVLEGREQPGKKLRLTGNGRCNFTNEILSPENYDTDDREKLSSVFQMVPPEKLRNIFDDFGIPSVSKDGYVYPKTMDAMTVLNGLKRELRKEKVRVLSDEYVTEIRKNENRFTVRTKNGSFESDYLVLSFGTSADLRPELFNGPALLRNFGLKTVPYLPALCELYGNSGYENFWDGVRMRAVVSYRGKSYDGEIQLKKTGISGINVFQISGQVIKDLRAGSKPSVSIDFLPDETEKTFSEKLKTISERYPEEPVLSVLSGMMPEKPAHALLKFSGFDPKIQSGAFSEKEFSKLSEQIKHFQYEIKGDPGFRFSQAASGGVLFSEVTEEMEAKKIPGLFLTGELLNVTGICGGYNLHFAFASGFLAGNAISERK